MNTSIPRQPWETEKQCRDRKTRSGKFTGFVGDLEDAEAATRDDDSFDFEHDVWTQPIELGPEHFKDGILAI